MIISDSDITYTNSGLFNGEDRGGRFVFQARIFRLLMPCLRLTVVLRPGIADDDLSSEGKRSHPPGSAGVSPAGMADKMSSLPGKGRGE